MINGISNQASIPAVSHNGSASGLSDETQRPASMIAELKNVVSVVKSPSTVAADRGVRNAPLHAQDLSPPKRKNANVIPPGELP